MIVFIAAIALSVIVMVINAPVSNAHEQCRRIEKWRRYYDERRSRARPQSK